jgi:hypothetical protein
MFDADLEVMLEAQIHNDQDIMGKAGMPETACSKLPFVEGPRFAKRSDVQGRKFVDMAFIGLTRIVDQASAHKSSWVYFPC